MFFPASAPPDCDAQGLRALRRSLNTPVIAIDLLPAGPASAAVALHRGSDHAPRVTIALRSIRTRQLAFFSADEERAHFGSPEVAVDAALSFAESMGFLFDDDEVEAAADAGSERADQIWLAFISSDPPAESPRVEPDELLLEEIDIVDVEPADIPDVDSGGVGRAHPDREPGRNGGAGGSPEDDWDPADEIEVNELSEVDPALLLTKFRRGSDAPGAPELPVDRNDRQIRVMSRF